MAGGDRIEVGERWAIVNQGIVPFWGQGSFSSEPRAHLAVDEPREGVGAGCRGGSGGQLGVKEDSATTRQSDGIRNESVKQLCNYSAEVSSIRPKFANAGNINDGPTADDHAIHAESKCEAVRPDAVKISVELSFMQKGSSTAIEVQQKNSAQVNAARDNNEAVSPLPAAADDVEAVERQYINAMVKGRRVFKELTEKIEVINDYLNKIEAKKPQQWDLDNATTACRMSSSLPLFGGTQTLPCVGIGVMSGDDRRVQDRSRTVFTVNEVRERNPVSAIVMPGSERGRIHGLENMTGPKGGGQRSNTGFRRADDEGQTRYRSSSNSRMQAGHEGTGRDRAVQAGKKREAEESVGATSIAEGSKTVCPRRSDGSWSNRACGPRARSHSRSPVQMGRNEPCSVTKEHFK
ncbi:unnamed protein product [Gongylonema pulchrum]|uniref:'chromo' domain containing protein n=1 Tax=Gongylonema pulchrum TaxID=637853 RepID=A0A183E9X0_9BILA|nr:unnamed protein product [Gongylonema pulchrum]